MNKKTIIKAVQTVIIAAVTFFLSYSQEMFDEPLLKKTDNMLKDMLYQQELPISRDIKIIAIDDKTLEKYGPFGTWSRSTYADLINILNSNEGLEPAVIGFDIMFFGNMDEEGDRLFAETAEKAGNVVLSSNILYNDAKILTDENGNEYIDTMYIENIEYPYEALNNAAESGFVNISADSDGVVRRIIPTVTYNGETRDSFSKVIYEKYCAYLGETPNEIITDRDNSMTIRFTGAPGDYSATSLCDVLDGTADPRNFAGAAVLVGAYAQGMQDAQSVPTSHEQMYGVEIHANVIEAMYEGIFPVQADRLVCAFISAVIAALLFILMSNVKFAIVTVIAAAAFVGEVFAAYMLSQNNVFVDLVYLPIMTIVSYVVVVIMNYVVERIIRNKTLNAFKKYVDPKFIRDMQRSGGDFKIELGGESRECALLFVDIRGFTALSECLTPKEVVHVLNKYLKLTTDSVINNGGTVDKFVGDCTMAIFNAPFDLDDYVFKAVCAGFDIISGDKEFNEHIEEGLSEESVRKLRERWATRTDNGVGFGVGIHCGEAVVGNIGCDFRMDYTAIGDTVNTAARIESGAKKAQLCISGDVYELVKDRVEIDGYEDKMFKNKSEPVRCYSVVGVKR